MKMKAIKNGKIILKDRIIEGKAIVFDNIIRDIADGVPAGGQVIDAGGNYVSPGLIDVHIHGFAGEDFSETDAAGVKLISESLVKHGVTGWLPTNVSIPIENVQNCVDLVRDLKEKSAGWQGSLILGTNMEGPYLNAKRKGAHNENYLMKPDADFIIRNADIIKIATIAPEIDEGFAQIRKIRADSGVTVSMGHTDATYQQAMDSIACGVGMATHLFNAMSPFGHRAPGVVSAVFNADIYAELIADTYHVAPELFQLVYKLKKDKLILISDCASPGGLEDGNYLLGDLPIILKDNLCKLPDGTIAGSTLTLNKGVKNFCVHTAAPLWEAVRYASLNPAAAAGCSKNKGSLEIGKDADIIIADGNFDVVKTIIGGEIKYEA